MARALSLNPASSRQQRKSYSRIPQFLEPGSLIQVQLDSFEWLKNEGIRELFDEVNPIHDHTGGRYELNFLEHNFPTSLGMLHI